MPGFKLICVVGMIETAGIGTHPTVESAREEGDGWLGDQEYTVRCEIEAGNYEAAEYPTYYVVEDADTGAEVYRSNRPA